MVGWDFFFPQLGEKRVGGTGEERETLGGGVGCSNGCGVDSGAEDTERGGAASKGGKDLGEEGSVLQPWGQTLGCEDEGCCRGRWRQS